MNNNNNNDNIVTSHDNLDILDFMAESRLIEYMIVLFYFMFILFFHFFFLSLLHPIYSDILLLLSMWNG